MAICRLRTGREVTIRPIRPDDGPHLQAAYRHLSAETQYRRFLTVKPQLSEADTRYLVDIDGHDHCALVATPVDNADWILGVARFVRLPEDPMAAEFAIVVGDPWQGEGLGTELLERLSDVAVEHGIDRFTATVLAENGPAHTLLRRLAGRFTPAYQRRQFGAVDEIEFQLAA
jgi:RimJ/RimL family protein N-acetyltransferase